MDRLDTYRELQTKLDQIFDKQIFFVVGYSKSGTTWLQFLLDAHPEVCCKGEGHFTDALYPALEKAVKDYNRQSGTRNRRFERSGLAATCPTYTYDDLHHLFRTAIGLAYVHWIDDPAVKCIGEKTPENWRGLDGLAAMFGAAKFIHIIRDGRDAAWSNWAFNVGRNSATFKKLYPSLGLFAEDFAKTWSQAVETATAFGANNPGRYVELCYEDLHREPEPIAKEIFEFLGVGAAADTVSACVAAASFERLTGGRERGEEKATAHMRKGLVGEWRDQFDEASRDAFRRHGGETLKRLGYDD